MNTFFTSDLHLGHANIIKYCNRPFSSVEEMDEELIYRWNSVVDKDSIIYHLGDFCFKDPKGYIARLNGKIQFIMGSHDSLLKKIPNLGSMFVLDHDPIIVLCHYAMRSWPASHYATWHLFGHHHGNLPPHGLSFDVGVDTNNFYPYSLDDVRKKMETLSPIVDLRKEQNEN